MEKTVLRHARVDVADVLRGLAVMGIVLLHSIEHFNFGSYPDTSEQSAWLTFTDRAVWDGLFFLLGGKAYAVFALLFGFSYFIQWDNQRLRGHDFRLRFCWRLVLLFLLGNLNAAFFTAEVLVLYSLAGFILPLVCRLRDKWLLALACVLLVQPLPLYYAVRAAIDPAFVTPSVPTGDLWAATYAVQSGGNFWETVRVNLWQGQLASLAWAWDNGRVFQTLALFLIGFLMGKHGWFLQEKLKVWNKVLCGSLVAFFPLYGLGGLLPEFLTNASVRVPLLLVVSSLYKFAFMLLLVAAIIQAYYRTNLRGLLERIIPYGKMSLTNYITQSIFGSLLYYNWGLALHDDVTITGSLLIGVAFFFVQWMFCRWWLRHHSHGPLEQLWKTATWIGRR